MLLTIRKSLNFSDPSDLSQWKMAMFGNSSAKKNGTQSPIPIELLLNSLKTVFLCMKVHESMNFIIEVIDDECKFSS